MNELAAEYGRADVFSLPSVQEGFGIVFLEAMAAGTPIVAARAAAVPEVVRNGVLVEPGNGEALADAILRLYRDPDLRASLSKTGSQDVEEFSMLRVARQFLCEVATIAPGVKVEEGPEVEYVR
jgi:glycosyltransferase involved in cell wall biosynthesis